MTETQSGAYPLWCIDKGDDGDENRYRGPFETRFDAEEALAEERSAGLDAEKQWALRRCRRLHLREVVPLPTLDSIVDELDDLLGSGEYSGPAKGWAQWEDSMLRVKRDWQTLLNKVLDGAVQVDAYLCEGDEEERK